MTQERMHPEDLRAIMAASIHAGTAAVIMERQLQFLNAPCQSISEADEILAELARTAKPEDEPEFLAWRQKAWDNASRAEKAERLLSESVRQLVEAEARVKELEDAIRFHQSSLVAGHEVDRQLWLKVK